MAECRFCARKLNETENHPTITEEVKDNFIKITQIELLESDICSKYICELCLRSLQLANALRAQLLENEQRLYALVDKGHEYEDAESPIQYFEPAFDYNNASDSNKKSSIIEYQNATEVPENSTNAVNYDTCFDPHIGYAVQKRKNNKMLNQHLSKPSTANNIEEPLLTIPIGRSQSEEEQHSIFIKDENGIDEDSVVMEEPYQVDDYSSLQEEDYTTRPLRKNRAAQKHRIDRRSSRVKKNVGSFTIINLPANRLYTTPQRSSEKVMQKNSKTNKFECIHCTYSAESKQILKTHIIDSHKTEIRNFKCPHCDSTYFKGSNLKRHVLIKHLNHRYNCVAPNCAMRFQERSTLRRHLISVHGKHLRIDELEALLEKTRRETGPLANLPTIIPSQEDLVNSSDSFKSIPL